MVTAETAVALPAVVVLLGGLLVLVAAVAANLRCVDAAREGARSAARGDPPATTVAVARTAAPAGAQVAISRGDRDVTVTVVARTPVLGGLGGSVTVRASATSRLEPAADDVDPLAMQNGRSATQPDRVAPIGGRHAPPTTMTANAESWWPFAGASPLAVRSASASGRQWASLSSVWSALAGGR